LMFLISLNCLYLTCDISCILSRERRMKLQADIKMSLLRCEAGRMTLNFFNENFRLSAKLLRVNLWMRFGPQRTVEAPQTNDPRQGK
jgi:hypothetical protein